MQYRTLQSKKIFCILNNSFLGRQTLVLIAHVSAHSSIIQAIYTSYEIYIIILLYVIYKTEHNK